MGAERSADDPMAAPAWSGEDDPEVVETYASLDEDGDDDDADHRWVIGDGYTDLSGTLRVWVDDRGRLERIHLGRYWRNRTGTGSLTDMFADVLSFTALLTPITAEPELDPVPTGLPTQLTRQFLSDINDRMEGFKKALLTLDPATGESTWTGSEASGSSESGRVKVTLDLHGRTVGVRIDDKFAANASPTAIGRAVLAAQASAVSRHVPPTCRPGERVKLLAQVSGAHEQIIAALRAGLPGYPMPTPDELSELSEGSK